MSEDLAQLVQRFNRYKAGESHLFPALVRDTLLAIGSAVQGLSAPSERQMAVANLALIKAMLDEDEPLFRCVYLALGTSQAYREQVLNAVPEVALPNHFASVAGLRREAIAAGVVKMPSPVPVDAGNLTELLYQSIKENNDYILRNPSVRWKVDPESGRIWSEPWPSEGRQRAYWLNTDKAPQLLHQLMNHPGMASLAAAVSGSPVHCESVLLEELVATPIQCEKRNWHFDKLIDQIKVFIPLEPIDESCGPLRCLPYTTPEQLALAQQPMGHLHYGFIYSAMMTTNNNFLPANDPLIQSHQDLAATLQLGEIALLDTRALHSGSTCRPGHRRLSMTLTYRVQSVRNALLAPLPATY